MGRRSVLYFRKRRLHVGNVSRTCETECDPRLASHSRYVRRAVAVPYFTQYASEYIGCIGAFTLVLCAAPAKLNAVLDLPYQSASAPTLAVPYFRKYAPDCPRTYLLVMCAALVACLITLLSL